ncbi:hypothetical protein EDM76_08710 [bacterium]|nr:MAG: hypothetical protein EDM76_08710 [bacterium]
MTIRSWRKETDYSAENTPMIAFTYSKPRGATEAGEEVSEMPWEERARELAAMNRPLTEEEEAELFRLYTRARLLGHIRGAQTEDSPPEG